MSGRSSSWWVVVDPATVECGTDDAELSVVQAPPHQFEGRPHGSVRPSVLQPPTDRRTPCGSGRPSVLQPPTDRRTLCASGRSSVLQPPTDRRTLCGSGRPSVVPHQGPSTWKSWPEYLGGTGLEFGLEVFGSATPGAGPPSSSRPPAPSCRDRGGCCTLAATRTASRHGSGPRAQSLSRQQSRMTRQTGCDRTRGN
jgi:hypothetical protein